MAEEVTRAEFEELKTRVTNLEGPAVKPKVFLQATPGTGYVDLAWSIHNTTALAKQFWVGRDGKDAGGHGPWEVSEPATARTRRFDKLVPGQSYKFHVDANMNDGTELKGEAVAVPLALPTGPTDPEVPTEPGSPGESFLRPPGKRSGKRVNLSLFKGGSTNLPNMDANPLNVQFDGALSFNTRGKGWDPRMDDGLIAEIIKVQKAGGFFIVSMPHSMDPDADMNRKGARNEYKAKQMAMAAYWKAKGVDPKRLIIRLCWEFNGGWYWWTAAAPGGVAALRESCRNFMDNWRAGGMAGTLFDACANMPSSASSASWRDLWLGKGYWDIFSIDQYDAYGPVRNAADWEKKMVPVQSVRRCAEEAKAFGVMWAIAECGNWHGKDGAYDNPYYWVATAAEVAKFYEHCAYWNIYDDRGAPANLFHDWANNPKSANTLKAILATW